ncbi:nucleic-acid-binding protein from transposon X-element [Trichonephila clavipes]|nr:nucleic-acid-binding protein from transposon X-element [Trichonephila clavipes]
MKLNPKRAPHQGCTERSALQLQGRRNSNRLRRTRLYPEKVNQLIGRRSKQPIPVFLVTLPRSIENLKIFHLKTLSYLSIRVEGYNGKGVTQCYTCNHFHHNSENCHLNPRCLKCGEGHITRECPITERLETAYYINCEMYGHMANWRGCPCFPKPPKGTALNNRNSYTNIYNSIIRPNVSYAQAANQIKFQPTLTPKINNRWRQKDL